MEAIETEDALTTVTLGMSTGYIARSSRGWSSFLVSGMVDGRWEVVDGRWKLLYCAGSE